MSSDGGLYGLLSRRWPGWHWTRHESGAGAVGTPDANVCAPPGVETWIELKKTAFWAVKFRVAQPAWLDRRWRCGGRVLVLVRQQAARGVAGAPAMARLERSSGPPRDVLWAFGGATVLPLARGGIRAVASDALLRTEGGPRRWDWATLEKLLTEPL